MKKAATKKTAKKAPKVVEKKVEEVLATLEVEEKEEIKEEPAEEVLEVVEEFVPDLEGVDSKPVNSEFSDADLATLDKFINIYSPPVINSSNAKLGRTDRGKSIIKVTCDKNTEGSMPKFIDGLCVVFE